MVAGQSWSPSGIVVVHHPRKCDYDVDVALEIEDALMKQ